MGEQKYVVVRVAEGLYAFRIGAVERILPGRSRAHGTEGGLTIIDQPLPLVDLRPRLDYEATARAGSWVVVHGDNGRVALKVDAVEGILTFSGLDIERDTASRDQFLSGVARHGHEKVVILEPDLIFPYPRRALVAA